MTTTRDKEAQPLAAFAYREGEEVIPDGYMKEGDTGQDATGNYTVEELAFKGYVKVWDNRTGVMSYQPKWLLWQTFQLKRPEDGSFIFTDRDPGIPQNYGLDLVCLLHPESPDYSMLKDMGFKPCYKKHTPTRSALDMHMQKTHKRAYAAMKDHMEQKRRDEDRELQMETIRSNQELIRAMAGSVTKTLPEDVAPQTDPETPLYISNKPKRGRPRRKRVQT